MSIYRVLNQSLGCIALGIGISVASADILAPQAPPELSDTLKDFRTKEQLSEHVYIEGQIDTENSLQVGTTVGDIESRVLRLSAEYQPHYVIAVPHHGVSLVRFYDLYGVPLEILSTRVEHSSFQAGPTASPSELLIRQLQDGPDSLLQIRLKGVNQNLLLRLKPIFLVNQQHSVHTLITAMTVNYFMEAPQENDRKPQLAVDSAFALDTDADYSTINVEGLTKNMLEAASLVLPLNKEEQEKGRLFLQQQEKAKENDLHLMSTPAVIKEGV